MNPRATFMISTWPTNTLQGCPRGKITGTSSARRCGICTRIIPATRTGVKFQFDKFWNLSGPPSGASGLMEFRAIESMPHARWMSLVALLWQAIAAHTLEHPVGGPLVGQGDRLHDEFFLPSPLWADLESVLGDLHEDGLDFSGRRGRSSGRSGGGGSRRCCGRTSAAG